jgi:hypothetical protein
VTVPHTATRPSAERSRICPSSKAIVVPAPVAQQFEDAPANWLAQRMEDGIGRLVTHQQRLLWSNQRRRRKAAPIGFDQQ